jgi:hypothetical protein
MQITYNIDSLTTEQRSVLMQVLNGRRIPHILEGSQLLIDDFHESSVDEILELYGLVQLAQPSQSTDAKASNPSIADYENFIAQMNRSQVSATQTSSRSTPKNNDDPGGIALAGLLIGGGFGVLVVIAAFSDPNYEGRVYLFLPAIIFGVIGFAIGSAIESGIRKTKKW